MTPETDLHSLSPSQRSDGSDDSATFAPPAAVDDLPAVDERGWVWTITADLDMGAWTNPRPNCEL
ncbi:MAG: hypothetical protein HOV83_03585 [Catenulispora sp.]|nr:hypothetical protein [Catenulispora sp.]